MGISRTIAKFIIGEIISFSIGEIIRWRVSVGNFDRASRRKQILGGEICIRENYLFGGCCRGFRGWRQ